MAASTRVRIGTLSVLLFARAASGQTIAIAAGTVIDPETGAGKTNQTILIDGGKIKEIGPAVAVPKDAVRVDLSKETVLPGLIDAHTHLLATVSAKWDLGDYWIMALQRRAGSRAIEGVRHAKEMLESGFTTVRDVGNSGDYLDADLDKAIREGRVPGPTMIFAGRIIAPFGGQFWDKPADARLLENPEYRFADSRDEMRKAVRENIYWGAGVIKIVVDGQKYTYSADDIRFIVEEAGRAGIKVAAHVQTEPGARAAIEAGVASIEHAWTVTDEDLALAKQNHVVLVGTDFTVAQLVAEGADAAAAKRTHDRYVVRLKRAWEAGVDVVFGTDVMSDVKGRTRGEEAIEYIDSFREAGIDSAGVIRSMTVRAAELLGVAKERGAIRAGMAADLVATPTNPLRDLDGLKRINFVMKNGEIHRRP
ncbi:MAG TPA: amidohydrolase family protein [Bryobacteraceae bacterium]|nr:amidohydrolase family protein [Bryobacteraceae bacterium]